MVPPQLQRPRTIPKVVAYEVDIPSIDEDREASIEHISNVWAEVLHPVHMELQVDSHVARLPLGRGVVGHVQGLPGGIEVEPLLDVGEIVAQGVEAALLPDVVGVESRHAVGGSEAHVAERKRRLASEGVDEGIAFVALVDEGGALGDDGLHRFIGALVDNLDVMRIVVYHLRVPLVLFSGIGEAVTHSDASEVDLDFLVLLGSIYSVLELFVLHEHLVCNGGCIVAAVALSHNKERI
mmetsp:Transcript_40278/g.74517  ORF Transcript_40278/g.74517 Transcript_40278/m.74517 type:complete len:238 (+) Transcript_40278:546-1259(+)